MKTQLLTGSKREIAERVAGLAGDVREAIVFIDDQLDTTAPEAGNGDIFADMAPLTVKADGVDYSRPAIYSRDDEE